MEKDLIIPGVPSKGYIHQQNAFDFGFGIIISICIVQPHAFLAPMGIGGKCPLGERLKSTSQLIFLKERHL